MLQKISYQHINCIFLKFFVAKKLLHTYVFRLEDSRQPDSIFLTFLAILTLPTTNTWLHRYPVTYFQIFDLAPNFCNNTTRFVAKNHGLFDNKIPDSSVRPVVHVRTTNSNGFDIDQHFCWSRCWNGSWLLSFWFSCKTKKRKVTQTWL